MEHEEKPSFFADSSSIPRIGTSKLGFFAPNLNMSEIVILKLTSKQHDR